MMLDITEYFQKAKRKQTSKLIVSGIVLKMLFVVAISLMNGNVAQAQKFGFIDSELILKKMPQYKEAQQEIDRVSINYQKEIEVMSSSLDSMYNVYRKEEILLTEEMKQKKKTQMSEKETEIKEYQRKIFGFEGLIFLKRQELIRPVQDVLYEAVERVSKRHKLQFVFDRAGDLSMIYANPVHDYTDLVEEQLEIINEQNKSRKGTPKK
ncbi:MAG: OmpH family outer membrane protein [Cyclobacteriaceae bacterium]